MFGCHYNWNVIIISFLLSLKLFSLSFHLSQLLMQMVYDMMSRAAVSNLGYAYPQGYVRNLKGYTRFWRKLKWLAGGRQRRLTIAPSGRPTRWRPTQRDIILLKKVILMLSVSGLCDGLRDGLHDGLRDGLHDGLRGSLRAREEDGG